MWCSVATARAASYAGQHAQPQAASPSCLPLPTSLTLARRPRPCPPQAEFMAARGELHRLAASEASWVFDSPPRFCARFRVRLEEWQSFAAKWAATSGARALAI